MKKIIQYVLTFFFIYNSFSQNNIGVATYSIKMVKDSAKNEKILKDNYKKYDLTEEASKKKIDGFLKIINKNLNDLDNVEYKLIFNKNKSYFYNITLMNDDENNLSNLIKNAVVQSELKFLFNFNSGIIIKQTEYDGKKYLIKSHKDSIKWKLKNEKKRIGKYLCYKATTTNLKKYPTGIKKENVTAWYCKDIPVKSGPNRYVGLPGLIVQLQEANKLFSLKQIKFSEKEKKIKELKGIEISKTEFEKIWRKDMNN